MTFPLKGFRECPHADSPMVGGVDAPLPCNPCCSPHSME